MHTQSALCALTLLLGLASGPVLADQIDIQKLINDAIANKATKLVIPPGEHRIDAGKRGVHLVIEKAKNLEIDGTGATLIFTDPNKPGITVNRCDNLTLRGFAIDYDPLPFTQGTITAVDVEAKTYDVKIDDGYFSDPTFFTGSDHSFTGGRMAAYLFDPQGNWKTDAWDCYPNKCERVGDNAVRLGFASADSVKRNNAQPGDRIVISRRTGGAIRMNYCTNSVVDGLKIYAAGGIGIQEASGEGGNRFSYTVTRGPMPKGATAPRLHSINADGFHSSAVNKGPIVENCTFEWMGDDAVAIHGTYALVTAASNGDSVTLSPKFELPFEVGDELTIIDGATYKAKGSARVTATAPATAAEDAAVQALWEKYKTDQRSRKFYTVNVDKPIGVAVGDLITSPQRVGNGYVVRNNVARHHRARGIQLKAGSGVIENNTIEDVNFSGITLGPEFSIWLGADYVKDVVVRNNTIRGTGRGAEARKYAAFADIAAIVVRSLTLDRELSPPENARIRIENNRIERPAGLAMFLSSTTDLQVSGNVIVAPWALGPSEGGKKYGVDSSAAVFVARCEGVVFENNTIELSGGTATKAVTLGADANNVTGADTGFTLKSPAAAEAR